jgi:hypothetical protein
MFETRRSSVAFFKTSRYTPNCFVLFLCVGDLFCVALRKDPPNKSPVVRSEDLAGLSLCLETAFPVFCIVPLSVWQVVSFCHSQVLCRKFRPVFIMERQVEIWNNGCVVSDSMWFSRELLTVWGNLPSPLSDNSFPSKLNFKPYKTREISSLVGWLYVYEGQMCKVFGFTQSKLHFVHSLCGLDICWNKKYSRTRL